MGLLKHLADRIRAMPAEVEKTAISKVAQGSAELGNALFSQSNAYSPVTAEIPSRAQYQQEQSQSRGIGR